MLTTLILASSQGIETSIINNPTGLLSGQFRFTLTQKSRTSAVVYQDINSVPTLVRTLWSAKTFKACNYIGQWDQYLDDYTILAPLGEYTIKFVSNNVTYTWEGVVGNSSIASSGNNVQKVFPFDMCFIGTNGYLATGYSEQGAAQSMFNPLTPNVRLIPNFNDKLTTQSTFNICTDGNLLYWGGGRGDQSYNTLGTFVYASYVSDNCNPNVAMYPFSSGTSYSFSDGGGANTYSNAISIINDNSESRISGMCVQKSGTFLFVSRGVKNQLQVLNKTSGALVQTLTFNNILNIECDDNNHIFIVYNNSVKKFIINNDGTLTDTNVTFTNLTTPNKLTISSDYTTIAVSDDSTFQIKFYHTTDGTTTGRIIGNGSNYATSPYITPNNFASISFIRLMPNGYLWVGDPSNLRFICLDQNSNYFDQIASVPSSRSCNVDVNNPKRVFGNFIEYERDYTKVLDGGSDGSWKHKANWGIGILNQNAYGKFSQVLTLSNNKTYGFAFQNNGNLECYELTNNGSISLNRVFGQSTTFDTDGNAYYVKNMFYYLGNDNGYAQPTKIPISFDKNNNPVWENETSLGALDYLDADTPYTPGTIYDNTFQYKIKDNKYIYFNNSCPNLSSQDKPKTGYHLGCVPFNSNNYSWKVSRSTFTDYCGNFPKDGGFDIGNSWPVMHNITHAMNFGTDIFWNANGEFWQKDSGRPEINCWNHFDDDGIHIGYFGVTGPEAQLFGQDSAPGYAGNTYGTSICLDPAGNGYYIYHCDESQHAGVHSWHVSGLDTIIKANIPINLTTPVVIPHDNTNLMFDVPFRSPFYGNSKISVYPNAGVNPDNQYPTWVVKTSMCTYTKDDIDIYYVCDDSSTTDFTQHRIDFALGVNNTNNWQLKFSIQQQGIGNSYKHQILDNAGKIILSIEIGNNLSLIANYQILIGENLNFFSSPNRKMLCIDFNEFIITNVNGLINISYGDYELSLNNIKELNSNTNQPAIFRICMAGAGPGGGGSLAKAIGSVKGVKFTTSIAAENANMITENKVVIFDKIFDDLSQINYGAGAGGEFNIVMDEGINKLRFTQSAYPAMTIYGNINNGDKIRITFIGLRLENTSSFDFSFGNITTNITSSMIVNETAIINIIASNNGVIFLYPAISTGAGYISEIKIEKTG